MRNINSHLRLFREETVLAHFRSLVVRERAEELRRQGPQFAREGLSHGGRIVGFQRHQHCNPCRPSTSVPRAEAWAWLTSTSPSQCPGTCDPLPLVEARRC